MGYTEEEILSSGIETLENLFEKEDLIWAISTNKNDILHSNGHNLPIFRENLSANSKILVKNVRKSIELLQMLMLVGLKLFGAIIFLMLTLLLSTFIIFSILCCVYFLCIYCFYFLFIIPLGILGKITDKLGDIQKGRLIT